MKEYPLRDLTRIRKLVFLCVQHSARSQMAEALARSMVPTEISCGSAGSQPYQVRQQALLVLEELQIDTAGLFSKGLSDVPIDDSSLIVTLCAEEICPATPGVPALHWPIKAPAGGPTCSEEELLVRFREARDEIKGRLEELLSIQ